jgi:hypothetical protein
MGHPFDLLPPYPDRYPYGPMDLQAMIDEMRGNGSFKRFIRRQLHLALGTPRNAEAIACLMSYCWPSDDDLEFLGDPEGATRSCTEHAHLLSIAIDF